MSILEHNLTFGLVFKNIFVIFFRETKYTHIIVMIFWITSENKMESLNFSLIITLQLI